MNESEKKAARRGMLRGAAGMLAVVLVLAAILLPGYRRHPLIMLKLGQIIDAAEQRYVGEFDTEELGDFAAYGMVAALGDRYSNYLPASTVEEYEANKYGETFGVGIQCVWDEERQGAHIYRVLDGSAALEEGVRQGDWITAADGVTAAEDGYDALIEAVRGEQGTLAQVTVLRVENGTETVFEVSLERRRLTQLMAEGEMLPGKVGRIRVFSFHQGVTEQFRAAYDTLREQGMEKLIIDVRHDGGGLVSEMTAIADLFLPECDVMIMRQKNGRETRKTAEEGQETLPLAVLVDAQSYSAAEFFAALMQEYCRAVTVGEQTTGKERAQNTYHLLDGSAVVLSDQQYLTPQGRALGETGMTPDIETDLPEETNFYFLENEEDTQLQAALAALAE